MRNDSSRWTIVPIAALATTILPATITCTSSVAFAQSVATPYESKVAGSTKSTKRKTPASEPIVVAGRVGKLFGVATGKAAARAATRGEDEEDTNDGPKSDSSMAPPRQDTANTRTGEAGSDTPPVSPFAPTATPGAAGEPSDDEPGNSQTQDAAVPSPAPGSIEIAARPTEGDIFGQWAAKKLKRSKRGKNLGPHPLARDYPNHYVVVCEAGCRTPNEQIVYMEPQEARNPVTEPPPEGSPSGSQDITCVGGCYNVGPGAAIYHVNGTAAATGGSDSWISTDSQAGTSSDAEAAGSRWYERINGNASQKESPENANQ